MQIEVRIDDSCREPKIVIFTASMTEEVNILVQKLSENNHWMISGSKNGKIEILEQNDLFKIYASNGKVIAVTDNGEYILRLRLYEAEERLNPSQFVRTSNSEIVNLKKVKNFDLSFTGTICVELMNGTLIYVSRRYVKKIKKIVTVHTHAVYPFQVTHLPFCIVLNGGFTYQKSRKPRGKWPWTAILGCVQKFAARTLSLTADPTVTNNLRLLFSKTPFK